ncbi:APC family permease [Pseudonocardia phyllosphaerae]|uniref:hypothetical protein n=1 Tax=Pseudonocardia phyllosphaerae TaxID=3390502 RepID=UPI00397A049B
MPRTPTRIPTATAVVVALGATFGTGLYAALAPAAGAAGGWLGAAILIAGLVAVGVVFSTAHLATARPAGPEVVVGDLPAPLVRLSDSARLVSRLAAAAAAAGVFGAYVLPSQPLPVAIVAVLAVVGVNAAGVRISRGSSTGLVVATLLVLTVVSYVGFFGTGPEVTAGAVAEGTPDEPVVGTLQMAIEPGPLGVLTAAAFVFFSYTGLSRVAELGGSLRDPKRAMRRAPVVAVAVTTLVLLVLGGALLHGLGASRLAESPTPLASLMDTGGSPALGVLVRIGAAAATAAALLGALSRAAATAARMSRAGTMPSSLGRSGPRDTPWVADLVLGAITVATTVLVGPLTAIAVSVAATLLHHALLHAAVLGLPARGPVTVVVAGAGGVACLALAATLPGAPLVAAAVVVVGVWALGAVHRRGGRPETGAGRAAPPDPEERAA